MIKVAFLQAQLLSLRKNPIPGAFCSKSKYPVMSGKGFGADTSKDKSKPPANQQPGNVSKKSAFPTPPSPSPQPFIPRGPTMRGEYEEKGLIEPSLSSDSGILPEIVANRMLRRILGFGGIPLFALFAFFASYFILKYKYDVTVLPVVVAYTTLSTIALSGLGITYGIFSSSWDEDIKGSFLGWEEAATNLIRAKEGLSGTRQRELREEKFAKIDKMAEKEDQEDKSS